MPDLDAFRGSHRGVEDERLVGRQDAFVQRVREVALAPLEHDRERPRIASG